MGLAYRVRQFFRVLRDRPDPEAWKRAEAFLEPQFSRLFLGMLPSDQAHALRVFSTLMDEGHTDQDLLAAALLHDIGKSVHQPTVLDRVIVILTNRLLPQKVVQWGASEPVGWRRPFSIASQHPGWGAELAAANGASPRVAELIRRHQDPASSEPGSSIEQLLAVLRRADSEN